MENICIVKSMLSLTKQSGVKTHISAQTDSNHGVRSTASAGMHACIGALGLFTARNRANNFGVGTVF